ncbi:MAG TPA: FAD-dependent oxidoreductase [Thermoplasmata archaeon]|nr:FAD-dependent oxidoreductase [Thermoplasmata archaeon]
MNAPTYDLAVVGGGIVGAACAYWAADAGLRVYACDRITAGAGTTGAGMGHIVSVQEPRAMVPLTRFSRRLWHELAARLPPSAGFRTPGTLWVAATDLDLTERDRIARLWAAEGVRCDSLDAAGLHALEPGLRPGLPGGLLVPGDGLVDPVAVTQFLWKAAAARGARVEPHRPVARLLEGAVERPDGARVSARSVVNATGVDASTLSPECSVVPRKGHLIRLGAPRVPLRHPVVELGYSASVRAVEPVSVAFNAQPQSDGTILLGASREWAGRDLSIDPGVVERLRARARDLAPSMADLATLEIRTGLRPATPDRLPWIGRLPGSESRWIAAGHEGLGVTTSLGTGRLLVDLLMGRTPAIDPAPFAPTPDRISGRPAVPP